MKIYDANRTAFLLNIIYTNGVTCYMLAIDGLKLGIGLISGKLYLKKIGCATLLKDLKAVIEAESDFGIKADEMNLYYEGKCKRK